jgi:hypothetical protein
LFQSIIFFILVYQVVVFLDSLTSYYPKQKVSFYLHNSGPDSLLKLCRYSIKAFFYL